MKPSTIALIILGTISATSAMGNMQQADQSCQKPDEFKHYSICLYASENNLLKLFQENPTTDALQKLTEADRRSKNAIEVMKTEMMQVKEELQEIKNLLKPEKDLNAELPSAKILKMNTTFALSSKIKVDCLTTGSKRTLWYKNGSLLRPNDRVTVLSNGTLLIKSSLPMDSGTYLCEATDYHTTVNSSVTIKVDDVSIPTSCQNSRYMGCNLVVVTFGCDDYMNDCCRSCAVSGQLSQVDINRIVTNLV